MTKEEKKESPYLISVSELFEIIKEASKIIKKKDNFTLAKERWESFKKEAKENDEALHSAYYDYIYELEKRN